MSFGCGHGSCEDCLTKMVALAKESAGNAHCFRCQAQIQAPVPDRDLTMQLHTASQTMVAQVANADEPRFDADAFKGTYNGLNSEEKKSLCGLIWVSLGKRVSERDIESFGSLERMLWVLSLKIPNPTEDDFVCECQNLKGYAKELFAEGVGYTMDKPEHGDNFLSRKVEIVRGITVDRPPIIDKYFSMLVSLVCRSGGTVPARFEHLRKECLERYKVTYLETLPMLTGRVTLV